MQIRSELGRSAGTKDGNPFLFFHLENPMDWEYTMVTVCVRQDCSDLTHEISLERFIIYIYILYITLVRIYYTCSFYVIPMTCSTTTKQFTYSFHFSRRAMSNSFWPHEIHHSRPPCPSPTPRVHANICSSGRWCHPAISSSVIPFSSWSKSLPSSEIFMSQLFAWGGQCTGVSALASVPPKNTQD